MTSLAGACDNGERHSPFSSMLFRKRCENPQALLHIFCFPLTKICSSVSTKKAEKDAADKCEKLFGIIPTNIKENQMTNSKRIPRKRNPFEGFYPTL
jgi:hypothetical protein